MEYKRRRILNEEQINWLQNYLNEKKNKRIVIKQIKAALESHFHEIKSISSSTIRLVLKKKLRYTYKKLNRCDVLSTSQESIQKFL